MEIKIDKSVILLLLRRAASPRCRASPSPRMRMVASGHRDRSCARGHPNAVGHQRVLTAEITDTVILQHTSNAAGTNDHRRYFDVFISSLKQDYDHQ